ncbi:hypothetical protein Tco_0037889 [Tanacetum coccineum]
MVSSILASVMVQIKFMVLGGVEQMSLLKHSEYRGGGELWHKGDVIMALVAFLAFYLIPFWEDIKALLLEKIYAINVLGAYSYNNFVIGAYSYWGPKAGYHY